MLSCFTVFLLYLTVHSSLSQVCYSPNTTVLTDSDLVQFEQCQTIDGDLVLGVKDCSQQCTIANLNSLKDIKEITGDLIIQCCNQITSTVSALQNLQFVRETLRIFYNSQLINIDGFQKLLQVGNVEIFQNPSLISVPGLNSLSLIDGYTSIGNNPKLERITGFSNLRTISGNNLTNDHAITIIYNPVLTDISGFRLVTTIAFGTVHIEGNTNLCYAGYPLWSYGTYNNRYMRGDMGIDWRSILISTWQFSWQITTGVPSLLIQNNGNESTCASTVCSDLCQSGAGCFGLGNDDTFCGSCYTTDGINSCDTIDRSSINGLSCPSWWPPTEEPFTTLFALALSFGIVIIVIVLIVIGCIAYKIRRRFTLENKGSYSFSSRSPDESKYESSNTARQPYHSPTDLKASSRERTVIGRGAGSSTSSTPSGRANLHVSHKNNKSGLGNGSISSSLSSSRAGRSNNNSLSNARKLTTTNSSSPNVRISNNSHVEKPVHYTAHTSTPEQFKNPLADSEQILQSISEHPVQLKVELNDYKETTTFEADHPWEEVSDIGQGMQQNMREDAWSDEEDSFDDESIDGDYQEEDNDAIPSDTIKLGKQIGKGSFGKVFEADAYGLVEEEEMTHVVVKQSNDDATEEELQIFLQPADAMKQLKHDNVLGLLGVSADSLNVMIIMEYCSNGNLKTFLRKQKLNAKNLKNDGAIHQIILDAALGIQYLHTMEIAHNDLAARNCLVTHDLRVKLGDYGFSRTAFRDDYYSRTPGQMPWPIRWMSPEMLADTNGVLDSQPATESSNVWSYGILLWEVCTFGELPYPKMTDEEVIDLFKTSGTCNMRNPVSHLDPLQIFHGIMRQCWRPENERAQMDDIVKQVDKVKDDFKQGKFNIKPSRPAPKKPVPKMIKPAKEEEKKIEPERVKVLPLLEETSRGDKRLAGVGEDKDVKQQQLTKNAKEEKGGKKKTKSKTDNLPPKEKDPVDPEQITIPSNRDSWGDLDEDLFDTDLSIVPPVEEPIEQVSESPAKKRANQEKQSKNVKNKKAPEIKPKPNRSKKHKEPVNSATDGLRKNDSIPVNRTEHNRKIQPEEEPLVDTDIPMILPPSNRDSWNGQEEEDFVDDTPIIPPVEESEFSEPGSRVDLTTETGDADIVGGGSHLNEIEDSERTVSRVNPLAQFVDKEMDDLGSLTDISTDEDDHNQTEHTQLQGQQQALVTQPDTDNIPHSQQEGEDDSWDEFEADDTTADKLATVEPPSGPERRESFLLPPDSPESTPPLSRRPSYLTPYEEVAEEEEEEVAEEEEEEEEERSDEDIAVTPPPPVPTSPPPEEEEEEEEHEEETNFDNELTESPPPTVPSINKDKVEPVESSTKHSKSTKQKVKEIKKEIIKEQTAVEPITHNEPEDTQEDKFDEPLKLDFLPVVESEPSTEQPVESISTVGGASIKETAKEKKQRERREKRRTKEKERKHKQKKAQKAAKDNSDIDTNETESYW